MSEECQLHIEVTDDFIIARIVGEPTASLFNHAIACIKQVVKDTGIRKILYDLRATETPYMDVILDGTKIAIETRGTPLVRAVVVPNSKLDMMIRIVFGEQNCRVFYQDMDAAAGWLKTQE